MKFLPLLYLLLGWLAGEGILYLYLKNKYELIKFSNISSSFILSGAIGVILSYLLFRASFDHWIFYIGMAGASAYITYRFLNKKESGGPNVRPLLMIPLLILMAGCDSEPDNKIHGTEYKNVGFKVSVNSDSDPTMIVDTIVYIQPTLCQGFYFASKSPGYLTAALAGVLLFALFVILLLLMLNRSVENSRFYGVLLALLLGLSLTCFLLKPFHIRDENKKGVSKAVYDKAMKESGSTKPIWDSLMNNHLIIGGPTK